MPREALFEAVYQTPSFGFRIRSELPDVGHRVDRLLTLFRTRDVGRLPVYWIRHAGLGPPFRVHFGGRCVHRSYDAASVEDFLVWDITARSIERSGTRYLALHAGVVGRGGKVVVLPAPPDSGKTTLTGALTRSGFAYLSDEVALIDPGTARVHPFPRPLAMGPETLQLLGLMGGGHGVSARVIDHVPVDALQGGAMVGACEVSHVVFPSYSVGSEVRLETISRAEAVVALAENAFNLVGFGAAGIRLLGDLVRHAGCYRLVMGDLDLAVEKVSDLIGAGSNVPN